MLALTFFQGMVSGKFQIVLFLFPDLRGLVHSPLAKNDSIFFVSTQSRTGSRARRTIEEPSTDRLVRDVLPWRAETAK